MGHQRLGWNPKSQKWDKVVETIVGCPRGVDPAALSQALAVQSLDAAAPALGLVKDDVTFNQTFYLLTQVALASRQTDWLAGLSVIGVPLSESSSVFDLASQLTVAIDDYVSETGHRSDIGEMAIHAATDAILSVASERDASLFGDSGDELRATVHSMSTVKGFSDLGQRFFGRFMARFLNFYLSRATAGYVGTGGLRNVTDVSRLNDSLQRHCEESARIVRTFCGEWYSKTEFQKGITPANTSGFIAVAVEKLRSEMSLQRSEL